MIVTLPNHGDADQKSIKKRYVTLSRTEASIRIIHILSTTARLAFKFGSKKRNQKRCQMF